MICVECGKAVNDIYREFSKGNIRLTRCEYCHSYADKYVEYENLLILIDLLLLKPQVYRHLLFNRTRYLENSIDVAYYKILAIFIFFEAYVRWTNAKEFYTENDIYWRVIFITITELIVYILSISLAVFYISWQQKSVLIKYNYLIMAIILSSFAKPLLLLTMIWKYEFDLNYLINCFILISNCLAVKIFLQTSGGRAGCVIAFGFVVRFAYQYFVSCLSFGVC